MSSHEESESDGSKDRGHGLNQKANQSSHPYRRPHGINDGNCVYCGFLIRNFFRDKHSNGTALRSCVDVNSHDLLGIATMVGGAAQTTNVGALLTKTEQQQQELEKLRALVKKEDEQYMKKVLPVIEEYSQKDIAVIEDLEHAANSNAESAKSNVDEEKMLQE
ncbi:unnamed protein product [Orchesella dallaii]|uniref:Uncharacterized protein n=1 Tax=Orchesella dallaii TaxID=48710 RepID=A0ABP1RPF7_9HEXA